MFEAIGSETDADLVEFHVRCLAKTARAFDMSMVLTPTLATATRVPTEAQAPSSDSTHNAGNKEAQSARY
jgi:hypothetical protein